MLIIKPLITDRNRWSSATLYTTREAAEAAGFGLMYEDNEGVVYGIRNPEREHCWAKIAFVPYEGFVDKYNNLATFEPEEYNGYKIYRLTDSKKYCVVDECDWLSGEDKKLTTHKSVESCKKYIDSLRRS